MKKAGWVPEKRGSFLPFPGIKPRFFLDFPPHSLVTTLTKPSLPLARNLSHTKVGHNGSSRFLKFHLNVLLMYFKVFKLRSFPQIALPKLFLSLLTQTCYRLAPINSNLRGEKVGKGTSKTKAQVMSLVRVFGTRRQWRIIAPKALAEGIYEDDTVNCNVSDKCFCSHAITFAVSLASEYLLKNENYKTPHTSFSYRLIRGLKFSSRLSNWKHSQTMFFPKAIE